MDIPACFVVVKIKHPSTVQRYTRKVLLRSVVVNLSLSIFLVVSISDWWFGTFFHILGIMIPTDFHIFQRGRSTTNQI